jgi:hypothetical protein
LAIEDLRATTAPLVSNAPAWLHEAPAPWPGPQTGQFGRSEAEAKLHRFGEDPGAVVASCEAIRGPGHGSLGLELPARPRLLPESHHSCGSVLVGAEGPKRLLTNKPQAA